MREIGIEPGALLLEPVGRNTAPALSLAERAALEQGSHPILVVTPADQTVADQPAFSAAMQTAIHAAEGVVLVILSTNPDRPETSYGYIKAATRGNAVLPTPTFTVERLVKEPDSKTAQRYLDEGGYYWNVGMFVLKASAWKTTRAAWTQRNTDKKFIRPGKTEFAAIPSESVDYAVMERCPGSEFLIMTVSLAAGWSDLDAWDAVWQVLTKDAAGNAHIGNALTTDSHNTLVHATSRLVRLVGFENLIVIETAVAVLVADRFRRQDVKAIVAELQASGRKEHTLHRKVHRPWGWYDGIDDGERLKVKRIQVKPKASVSPQTYHFPAEHWVVVNGTAEIICGDKTVLLTENQSTYIPLGEVHRLTNPGTVPLEIIEVQSGSYLGKDNIVRFEDSYGR